ncbi:MAG: hypothetical protein ACRCST_08640 [Turicibacter sp.]
MDLEKIDIEISPLNNDQLKKDNRDLIIFFGLLFKLNIIEPLIR